ncbi:hypothetical protein Ancab_006502 [Ancistrocladus abbreviatus]
MEAESQWSFGQRASHRPDNSMQYQQRKNAEGGLLFPKRFNLDYPMKILWKKVLVRLLLVASMIWILLILTVLLFHIWSCQSSIAFFSVQLFVIERERYLSCYTQWDLYQNHHTAVLYPWLVHCGFMHNGGAEMDPKDIEYVKKCKFVVASGIFDGYDMPHQPSNISIRSQKLLCFLMVVDEKNFDFIKKNVSIRVDNDAGHWVGIWRLILLKNQPYAEPRRNGKC